MELYTLLLVIIVLDIAAWRWGIDSRDTLNSPEWGKRAQRRHVL
ncbi:MAG TPA: hypothetical protein VF458_01855 [Ktedonobacteraceae bacterium]